MAKILCFFHLLIQETVVEDDSNVQDMLIQEISEILTNCKNYLSGSLQSANMEKKNAPLFGRLLGSFMNKRKKNHDLDLTQENSSCCSTSPKSEVDKTVQQ